MNDLQEIRPRAEELGQYRGKLMRFAMQRLRNPAQAEDAVQETLIAAIEGVGSFAADSSMFTWLTGILRHKIVDSIRKSARDQWLDLDPDTLSADSAGPEEELACRGFFERLECCMAELPARAARVFVLREVMGLDTAEVCAELAISTSNCSVLLHRARARLRERLAGERLALS